MATKMVTGFSELKYEINFKNGINYTGNGLYGPSLLEVTCNRHVMRAIVSTDDARYTYAALPRFSEDVVYSFITHAAANIVKY